MTKYSTENKFASVNKNIGSIFSLLSALSIVKQNQFLSKRLGGLGNKLATNQLQLVVLGQFKRGKTTLINALIGEKLLPTSVIPLTSIITILKYGKRQKLTVYFLKRKEKEIDLDQLADYVTEPKNPHNQKGVREVVIEYPSEYLKKGVEIIDTPGVGSVHKHNTDIAYEFVPKADAGIFVVCADPPISNAELDFLVSIKDYLGRIFFVQNKVDQVAKDDIQSSSEFTRKIIEESLSIKNLKFYSISAKLALEGRLEHNDRKLRQSQFTKFETEFNRFLTLDKEQILTKSVISKLLGVIQEINLALAIEKQAVQTPLGILRSKITQFEQELEKIQQNKEDSELLLAGQAQKLTHKVLTGDIEILQEEKLPQLLSDFDKFYQTNRELGARELSKALDSFLEKSIRRIFTDFRKQEETKFQKELISILNRFSEQTNNSIEKILELSSNLFNIKLEKFDKQTELAAEFEFRFAFDEAPVDIEVFKPIVSHLPRFIANKLLYKNMRQTIAQELDRHCGRSRYDFEQRVLQSIEEYRQELNKALDETVEGIKQALHLALAQRKKQTKSSKELLVATGKQEEIVSQVKSTLGKLLIELDREEKEKLPNKKES